jgi:hypothetical protein
LEAPSHPPLLFPLAILVSTQCSPQKPQLTSLDFADFADAPDPSLALTALTSTATAAGSAATATAVPYTKWYNVHERHSLSEFKNEGYIAIILLIIIAIHLIGTSKNRKRAKAWITAYAPVLQKEFALVGFGGRGPSASDVESEGLLKSMNGQLDRPVDLLKEKSLDAFATYATGRQNIAFVDVTISLIKRYNPFLVFVEYAMNFFLDSMPAPVERMEAILYPFDGKEALTVPGQLPGAHELRKDKSSYDNFVWAIVNKETMKSLRDERFDVSITQTKDNAKLPVWATIMSESAEITDALLTPELISAVEQVGEDFDHLIITDQPIDKPTTYVFTLILSTSKLTSSSLNETTPKKRVYLSVRLPSSEKGFQNALPLFQYFLRLPDQLVQVAHFRPEVNRKIKATRDQVVHRLQKADEEEKAEERALERDKAKKIKRDLELKGLDAKAQKKYLEKERERELRKSMKKGTQKA